MCVCHVWAATWPVVCSFLWVWMSNCLILLDHSVPVKTCRLVTLCSGGFVPHNWSWPGALNALHLSTGSPTMHTTMPLHNFSLHCISEQGLIFPVDRRPVPVNHYCVHQWCIKSRECWPVCKQDIHNDRPQSLSYILFTLTYHIYWGMWIFDRQTSQPKL